MNEVLPSKPLILSFPRVWRSLPLRWVKKELGVADINLPSEGTDLDELMNRLEKNLLLKALERTQGIKKKSC